MNLRRAVVPTAALIAVLVAATPVAASQAPGSSQGPLVLQPIDNAIVFSPDVKITNIADSTGVLLGGYAGVYLDRTFLIGGAGYFVVDPSDVVQMGYGGLLLGWRIVDGGAFSLSVRDLIGGGSATFYPRGIPVYPAYPNPRYGHYPAYPMYPGWVNFFVTEPEVRAQLALGRGISVDAGVGYRWTASGYGYGSTELLNGFTGSIGVRFNLGK